MMNYLRGVIIDISLNFGPLDSLRASLAELCRDRRHHSVLLQGLQELASHSNFQVRRYVAILSGVCLLLSQYCNRPLLFVCLLVWVKGRSSKGR